MENTQRENEIKRLIRLVNYLDSNYNYHVLELQRQGRAEYWTIYNLREYREYMIRDDMYDFYIELLRRDFEWGVADQLELKKMFGIIY